MEEIEASYFNETPPNDGHRRNILAPEHTHVGIALARGRKLHDKRDAIKDRSWNREKARLLRERG